MFCNNGLKWIALVLVAACIFCGTDSLCSNNTSGSDTGCGCGNGCTGGCLGRLV